MAQMSKQYNIQVFRGIAIFLVIVTHSNIFSSISSLSEKLDFSKGVDLFFVISGFLMGKTYISKIDLSSFSLIAAINFYIKRLARIVPATVFWGIITILSYPIWVKMGIFNGFVSTLESVITGVSFLGNFYLNQNMNRLGFWWSLGLEVQFYLILPIIVWLLTKYFWKGIGIISLILIIPFLYQMDNMWVFRLHSLFLGLLAWKVADLLENSNFKYRVNQFNYWGVVSIFAIVTEIFLFKVLDRYQAFMNFQLGLIFSVMLVIVYYVKYPILNNCGKLLVFLGEISFSLYLCHGLVFAIVEFYLVDFNKLYFLIAYPISVILAYISYKYIEQIMTNRLNKFLLS